jgi:hypothetical protein
MSNNDTTLCRYCGKPTRMTETGLCDPCWEADRRVEQFAKTRAGRKRLRQALRRAWPVTVKLDSTSLTVVVHKLVINFWGWPWNHWDWHMWHPKHQAARYVKMRLTIPGLTFETQGPDYKDWPPEQ